MPCRGRGESPDALAVNQAAWEVHKVTASYPQCYVLVHCTHGFNRTGNALFVFVFGCVCVCGVFVCVLRRRRRCRQFNKQANAHQTPPTNNNKNKHNN